MEKKRSARSIEKKHATAIKKPFVVFFAVALLLFLSTEILGSQAIVQDPFENPPGNYGRNCDMEYRFQYDAEINTIDDFIQFLKNHQSEEEVSSYKPTKNYLIPLYTQLFDSAFPLEERKIIDIDKLKHKVETFEILNSKLSNKKIYKLKISSDYYYEGWPWSISVTMSDKGYVSVIYCAGI